ncbi:MAG: hypothetical protein ACM3SY_03935 [Candidatus Omnitrophota bacterium]
MIKNKHLLISILVLLFVFYPFPRLSAKDTAVQADRHTKCQLKVVDPQSGREWKIKNILLKSQVEINVNGKKIIIPVNRDGSFKLTKEIPSGVYDVICRLNYYDYILYSNTALNAGTQAPKGGKLIRQSIRKISRVKIEKKNPVFDIQFPPPIILVHGILSGWTRWDSWVSNLLNQGYIVFTPNHDFFMKGKEDEAAQLDRQSSLDLGHMFQDNTPNVFFICHSEGGIVMRVLVNRYPTWNKKRIKGIFTLGTPHSGTDCFGARLFGLDTCSMIYDFNPAYPNFNGIPVYAIAGHGLSSTDAMDSPNDGLVFWNDQQWSNKSPFAIYQSLADITGSNLCSEHFSGYSDTYTANGHHFPYSHSNLVAKGVDTILNHTILPIMEGTVPANTQGENLDSPGIHSKPFLRKILDRTFTLSRRSPRKIPFNVSSPAALFVNAAGIKSNINLILMDPDGKRISPDNYAAYPSASYSSDMNGYQISKPKPGIWMVEMTAGDSDDMIALEVSEKADWTLTGYTDKRSYPFDAQVVLNAKLFGETEGVTVSFIGANISSPEGTRLSSFELFDDGNHNDKGKGDGIYGNHMTLPNINGKYLGEFHVEAVSNGHPVQSEFNWNFYVRIQ